MPCFSLILVLVANLFAGSVFPTHAGILQIPSRNETAAAGKIKGVVTYYFNDNFGDKGDVGSKVVLVKGVVKLPSDTSEFVVTDVVISIKEFLTYKEYKQNQTAEKNNLPLPHPVPTPITAPVLEHTMVDMNGNFEFEGISPGDYTVIIQSSHSAGEKKRDEHGRMACLQVTVMPNHVTDASYKFPANG